MCARRLVVTRLHEVPADLELGESSRFSGYRGLRTLDDSHHRMILASKLRTALEAGGVCHGLCAEAGSVVAVCAVSPLEWDSSHFGIPMARLVMASKCGVEPASIRALVETALAEAGGSFPLRHVSASIDIDDYECANALLASGFEILDIKRSFFWLRLDGVPRPKFLSCVSEYERANRAEVLSLLDDISFDTRFSRDPLLPQHKVVAMYRLWFKQLLDQAEKGQGCIALVFRRAGRIRACGIIGETDLAAYGVPMTFMDKGLYVSSREGVGGYFPVIYQLARLSLARGVVARTMVSLNNHSAVRVLEAMRSGSASTCYEMRLLYR